MLFQVYTENGVKKIKYLTADTGTGAPVGSLIAMYKKSSPSGYLYCDGSTFDETAYPALYQYLGSNVLPDYREFALVGAEQNTTDTIASHDVYTQGEAKDDQLQEHTHYEALQVSSTQDGWGAPYVASNVIKGTNMNWMEGISQGRKGTVTRGKRKAVYFYIKATSGLTENQQENVLNTINENLSYSTTEHKTGKKWIDGKPIYSKVIENLSVGQTDVSSLNIDMVISLTGLTFDANVNYLSFPYCDSAHGFIRNLYYSTTTKNIFYQAEGGSNTKTWAFIEYTKTTD